MVSPLLRQPHHFVSRRQRRRDHGKARHWWQAEGNPDVSNRLLNRCGYWFFPKSATLPTEAERGASFTVRMEWLNRGVAPAYRPYQLHLVLYGPGHHRQIVGANNRRWLLKPTHPDPWSEAYRIDVPKDLPPGRYKVSIKMVSPERGRNVQIALEEEALDRFGFLTLGHIQIK